MLSCEEIASRLLSTETGFKNPSHDCFKEDIKYFPKYVRKGVITVEDEEDYHCRNQIYCNVPGCEKIFQSVFAYQSHYNSLHRYICSQCKKSLPTPHLLDLHLSENHDSYFAVMCQSKPMFVCFLEQCHYRSSTPEERKDHCISAHKFPLNFRFENFCMVGKKLSSGANAMEVESIAGEKEPSKKTTTSFSFGHTKSKTFKKSSYAKVLTKSEGEYKNSLEDSKTVVDLLNSLPE